MNSLAFQSQVMHTPFVRLTHSGRSQRLQRLQEVHLCVCLHPFMEPPGRLELPRAGHKPPLSPGMVAQGSEQDVMYPQPGHWVLQCPRSRVGDPQIEQVMEGRGVEPLTRATGPSPPMMVVTGGLEPPSRSASGFRSTIGATSPLSNLSCSQILHMQAGAGRGTRTPTTSLRVRYPTFRSLQPCMP